MPIPSGLPARPYEGTTHPNDVSVPKIVGVAAVIAAAATVFTSPMLLAVGITILGAYTVYSARREIHVLRRDLRKVNAQLDLQESAVTELQNTRADTPRINELKTALRTQEQEWNQERRRLESTHKSALEAQKDARVQAEAALAASEQRGLLLSTHLEEQRKEWEKEKESLEKRSADATHRFSTLYGKITDCHSQLDDLLRTSDKKTPKGFAAFSEELKSIMSQFAERTLVRDDTILKRSPSEGSDGSRGSSGSNSDTRKPSPLPNTGSSPPRHSMGGSNDG